MSKVKQAIEKAIECVNNAGHNTYGANIYTFTQVQKILNDLLDVASEDDTAGVTVTRDQLDNLVTIIEESIDSNIHNMSDSDIVDEDSLEVSISGTRASIDSIDVDKDNIIDEASDGIANDVYGWAERIGIFNEN